MSNFTISRYLDLTPSKYPAMIFELSNHLQNENFKSFLNIQHNFL
nr:MAG TPA: hypothetical protein [Caudoviricetes sp.]